MTAPQPGPGAADGAERAALFARATSERAAMGKHAWVAAEVTCQKAFPKGAGAARHGCSTAAALCGKTADRYSKKLPDSPGVKSLLSVTPNTGPRDPILIQPATVRGWPPPSTSLHPPATSPWHPSGRSAGTLQCPKNQWVPPALHRQAQPPDITIPGWPFPSPVQHPALLPSCPQVKDACKWFLT